jgi:hypothetical protein
MADFRTSTGDRPDQPDIVLHLSDDARMAPRWLLDFFEDSVASGKQFKAEETVQIGWMVTKLVENPEGDLEVWEPRFRSVPIEWVRGVNATLRHLILQKSVADLFHRSPEFPSLRQAGYVAPSFWTSEGEFVMTRESPVGNDSGWRFSHTKADATGGEPYSLFEIACHSPTVVPFLALPPTGAVVRDRNVIVAECAGGIVSSQDNELLKRIQQNRNQ